ncbi:MAG: 3-deoxy-7-phosphoheptulonate synthase class II, partial [Candidatus Electrothrix sp. AUS3]|nr:3-deoxy-7-phosphoheptulonate synthase class II [Candidatus Electrothrix gigas]
MTTTNNWTKSSWQNFPVLQQPNWPDEEALNATLQTIETLPPLVFAGEIRDLKSKLAQAVQGKAFLLQGGDCSEE